MTRDGRLFGLAALLAALIPTPAARAADVKAEEIAAKMVGVTDELGRKVTGEPVQGEQKAIVRDLDELIASLEKQCEECRGNRKRNNPKRGAPDSMISSGTGGIGTLVETGDNGKDWGKLSDRERDRILQSMSEGFPPEYRTVLERYYRRLAEEKSAKAPAGRTAPADQPAMPAAAKP